MIKTSERLLVASELYKKHLFELNQEYRNEVPTVYYPREEVRHIFKSVDYNPSTGILIVNFEVFKYRKRINGYRQVNYVKHPIYSSTYRTAMKDKNVKIKFKEGNPKIIVNNEDNDIRRNYKLILLLLENITLYPDYLQREILEYYHDSVLEKIEDEISKKNNYYNIKIESNARLLEEKENKIQVYNTNMQNKNTKIEKLFKRVSKFVFKKNSLLLSILTLGILNINIRIARCARRINQLNLAKFMIGNFIENETLDYQKKCLEMTNLRNEKSVCINDLEYNIIVENEQHDFDLSNVSYPFFESRVKKDPVKKEIEQYFYNCKYDIKKLILSINDEFVKFEELNLSIYKDLQVPGVILFINESKTELLMCLTNDIWKFLDKKITKFKKSNYFKKHFLNYKEYKTKITLVTNPKEIEQIYYTYKELVNVTVLC